MRRQLRDNELPFRLPMPIISLVFAVSLAALGVCLLVSYLTPEEVPQKIVYPPILIDHSIVSVPILEPVVHIRDAVPLQRITAYNAVPEQTSADPTMSSCGPTKDMQIALSRDLFFDGNRRKHLCDVEAIIFTDQGHVYYATINDTMHERWNHAADVLLDPTDDKEQNYREAMTWGIRTGHVVIRH